MIEFSRTVSGKRYMLWMMSVREFKARYAGSALGFLWALFIPLFMVAVYGVVFGVFFRLKPGPVYQTENFVLFLLCGLVPWQFLAQNVIMSANSILANRSLVKKTAGFSPELLPIVPVLCNFVGHGAALALLIAVMSFFDLRAVMHLPLVLPYLACMILLSIGLGWILSSLNVFFRDIGQALGPLTMAWFFLTPITYSAEMVPSSFRPLLKINPMYHVVEGYRMALLNGDSILFVDFLYLAAATGAIFCLGALAFRRLQPWFAEAL